MSCDQFTIIRDDITKVKADAIVNTANPKPAIGGGTDRAIYDAAGSDKLMEARAKIGSIKPGEAYVTPAFALDANIIIHTVGPIWENGEAGEIDVLESCYNNSLELACQYKCKSVAFPLISSGAYGFPKDVAVDVAKKTIGKFLETHDINVMLIVFDDEALIASKAAFIEIREMVDSEYVLAKAEAEGYLTRRARNSDIRMSTIDQFHKRRKEILESGEDLKGLLGGKQYFFADRFFEFLDGKKLDPKEVYGDYFGRKTFSKIQTVKNYHPSKGTAIQACLGLRLTLSESMELLASANYAFNMHFDPDVIVMYCIVNKKWNIRDINELLEEYGFPDFDSIY